jgi:Nuclease-related domain
MAFDRKKRTTRLPVQGPLRRLPGQSIRDERERLFDDKAVGYLLAFILVWAFAIWQWIYWWTGAKPHPELITFVAVAVSVYCFLRLWRLRDQFKRLNLGERGERHVSDVLRRLRPREFITFDDLLLGDVNVDHVVVGPPGVFAIETKAYSVFGNGQARVDASGELRLGGKPALKDILKQARATAAQLSSELERYLRRKVWVEPVIVLPGWKINLPECETDVVVLSDKTISEFFESRAQKLSNSEIREICSHLDRTARA